MRHDSRSQHAGLPRLGIGAGTVPVVIMYSSSSYTEATKISFAATSCSLHKLLCEIVHPRGTFFIDGVASMLSPDDFTDRSLAG